MKLKLGLLNKDLAVRFNISTPRMSKIFRSLVSLIAAQMTNLILWPDHGMIWRYLRRSFKKNFKDCVGIIDCSETLKDLKTLQQEHKYGQIISIIKLKSI